MTERTNAERPVAALSCTIAEADMSLYSLDARITPSQSGYALMLARFSIFSWFGPQGKNCGRIPNRYEYSCVYRATRH